MKINTLEVANNIEVKPLSDSPKIMGKLGFKQLLDNQSWSNKSFDKGQKTNQTSPIGLARDSLSPADTLVKLGTLSNRSTSVAQLLLKNPELKSQTWAIIHDPVNKDKAFTQIPSGKAIFFDPKTKEIHWNNQNYYSPVSANQSIEQNVKNSVKTNKTMIDLGQLNQQTPTIAHLLAKNSEFSADKWTIIHNNKNNDKNFTQIPNNSRVFMDAKTQELSWIKVKNIANTAPANSPVDEPDRQTISKLNDAVKPFMGTDYKHMDCYTMVVNGLENMGVRYRGKGSLSRDLLQRAENEGRANNAFFTGEGIIQAIGTKVYSKAIIASDDTKQQSQNIFKAMQANMQQGDILSFSLRNKGHMGVISRNTQQWTFINSGRLDHSISDNAPHNGVGEETLVNEIQNWVKRARRNNESLKITLGRIDESKKNNYLVKQNQSSHVLKTSV